MNTAAKQIRILTVDDHPLLREGIAALVNAEADLKLVGEASNGVEAVEKFRAHRPDVTLMDLQMPEMNGIAAIRQIRGEFPDARIIVLTTYSGDVQVVGALKAGARGYILKGHVHRELLDTIRAVAAGQKRIPPEIAAELAEHATDDDLTHREVEVLQLIAGGNSNKMIADVPPFGRATRAGLPLRERRTSSAPVSGCLPRQPHDTITSQSIMLALKFCALAFSALLPLINPLGSALLFLGVVGYAPPQEFRLLAKKVAVSTVLFLLIIELAGAAVLTFFGISLPVVQLAGGLVLAAMGWGVLNQNNAMAAQSPAAGDDIGPLEDKIFYPLTFPITAGPGCIVVTLTLSAHASKPQITSTIFAHLGIAAAIAMLGVSVWLCYAYAPRITQKISPQTTQGILRVIAFVLLCIGVQIGWKGLEALMKAAK